MVLRDVQNYSRCESALILFFLYSNLNGFATINDIAFEFSTMRDIWKGIRQKKIPQEKNICVINLTNLSSLLRASTGPECISFSETHYRLLIKTLITSQIVKRESVPIIPLSALIILYNLKNIFNQWTVFNLARVATKYL